MRPGGSRFAFPFTACVVGVALIAASLSASAQQPKPAPRPAGPIARPAAPAFHPAPAPMARPAPAMMARPAAPAFHPAAGPPRLAMAPHPMPHFAAPAREAPRFAARPSVQRPAAMPRSAATAAAPGARQAFAAPAREQRILERQQVAQQRQRDTLSRRSTEHQARIDRLQQHVTQLQAQAPQGRRARRELAAQHHQLQREQLAQQRDQARQQKLGAPPTATAAVAQPTAKTTAAQAAARGRFAAHFRDNADPRAQLALAARLNGWAPRQAWRHHARAAFVPWLGPVFWPYAYADIFDYTFWPQAYDDAYWAYAYDDFVDTVFWDAGSPYSAYASIAPEGTLEPGSAMVGSSQLRQRSGLSPRALRQLCLNPEQGVTAWPFAEITRALRPSAEQRALLDQLKKVAAQAAEALKSSCSDDYALTPPGRLRAMVNRISATLEAVRMVRPALEAFYNALSDEQRARFNALGPQLASTSEDRTPQDQQQAKAKPENCGAPKSSLTELPIERIDAVLHPTDAQKPALDRLSAATSKAVQTLQAACPDEVPVTPVGRLQAMEKRLSALLQAANQVQPALDDFYASLTNDQKQRFNTLQQVAGQ
jgi:LTXXQ motif family protein